MDTLTRYTGCILGLAAGDSLGTTLEFCPPGSFAPLTDMVGGGAFNLIPGQWTDDTSMALCLAESLLAKQGFDPIDQMERYLRWYREGYLSSSERCFDIGTTVREALRRFETSGNPWSGSADPFSAGNGSIMRLAPVVMYYAKNPEQAIAMAAESSKTTHGATEAVDGCRYLAALLVGALRGDNKDNLLSPMYSPIPKVWMQRPLAEKIALIAAGSYKHKNPPAIKGSGYVVDSLEAALWAFYHSDNFRDGALLAVNLGNDADTTGAVYGQLAGAFYGEEGIPKGWRDKIYWAERIKTLGENLQNN